MFWDHILSQIKSPKAQNYLPKRIEDTDREPEGDSLADSGYSSRNKGHSIAVCYPSGGILVLHQNPSKLMLYHVTRLPVDIVADFFKRRNGGAQELSA